MGLKSLDPDMLKALRLLVDHPEVIETALAMASAAAEPAPVVAATVGDLWNEWRPWGRSHIPSFRQCEVHERAILRTILETEDGRKVTLFDLAWNECTPHAADLYRTVRQATPNRSKGTIGGGTINRELSSIQTMFNYFVRIKRTIGHNPIAGHARADEQQNARKTYLTPAQVQAFVEAGPPMFQDICMVAYRCAGMRATEARLLKKSEVDFESRVINLPSKRNKNKRARPIPFPDDVEVILRRHSEISRGPLIFVNPRDPQRLKEVPEGTLQDWLKRARKDSGIVGFDGERVVIHTLRHSAVTQLVQDGAQESHVKAAAGMSDQTFRRYNHFNRPQQEILRAHMNRQPKVPSEPVPITATLRTERKDSKKAPDGQAPPRYLRVASEDE